jgi:hypothetical protein
VALATALVAFSGSAGADANADYASIHADFAKDAIITPCVWTVAQLTNAQTLSNMNPEDQYNGFPAALDTELARWRAGKCNVAPGVPSTGKYTFALSVTPSRVRAKQFYTFTFKAVIRYKGKSIAIPGALARFAGHVRTTAKNGTSRLRTRFTVTGTKTVTFTRARRRLGTARVTVIPAVQHKAKRK